MGSFEAFIYGLVQGATEYLPVSSSAHLVILPHLFKNPDPGLAFDVILHIGTLLATAVYFFGTWLEILKTPMPKRNARGKIKHLSWVHLIIGTVPAVICGLVLNHWIQDHMRSLVVLWVTMPLFGILLWAVDAKSKNERNLEDASFKDMLVIGCIQSFALIPGVSRSGSTITAARLLHFNRADAARMSFLLSMPITLGAIVHEARHWNELVTSMNGAGPLIIGCVTAFIFGAAAIHVMIKWVSKTDYKIFAIYRTVVAIFLAAYLGKGE